MMNNMLKLTTERGTCYVTCPVDTTDQMIDLCKQIAAGAGCTQKAETFKVGQMPLEKLPEDIQEQVCNILKAYARCSVTFEHNAFHVSAGHCIKSSYGYDHFPCGEYLAENVYSLEERRRNYEESFGCPARF